MSEERVVEALKALREADRHCEAGPQVEIRLMQAVARRRAARLWMRSAAVAVAAAAAVVILLHARRSERAPDGLTPVVTAVVLNPEPVTPEPPPPVRTKPAPREVTTKFYPLMELAPPFERGELVRMTLPASTMRDVGLFVNASHMDDPVQADVLIGQEGLARAIRFVSYQ
jgi:hypothetical protein